MGHGHVGALIVADHQALADRELTAREQLPHDPRARLFDARVGGDHDAVKGVEQAEGAQLRHREAGLGVREQKDPRAALPQRREHLLHPGIERQLPQREQPEKHGRLLHAPPVGHGALCLIERAEDLPQLDLVERVAVPLLLGPAEAQIFAPQLRGLIRRAVFRVVQRGLHPELAAALVGADIGQRAVEIEDVVFVGEAHAFKAAFGTTKTMGRPSQRTFPSSTVTAPPSSRFS